MKKLAQTKLCLLCVDDNIGILKCSKCQSETNIGKFSLTIGKATFSKYFRTYLKPYQCQDCGEIKFSDEEINLPDDIKKIIRATCVALNERCKCGGQFRRDKNIFCQNCNYRKTKENKSYANLYIYKKTLDKLFTFQRQKPIKKI